MIEVEVEDPLWPGSCPDAAQRCVEAASAALDHLERAGRIVILLCDDEAQQGLNSQFRGRDGSTNVLSFPAVANPEGWLGDISLARETVESEATAQGKSLQHHLSHLVVHGVLHLCGLDHQADDEAERMEQAERLILARLQIADPYREIVLTHG